MTSESRNLGTIGRSLEFHYSKAPEKETGEVQSGLTPRAWNIAKYMVEIARLGAAPAADEDRRKIGNLLTVAGQKVGATFTNIDELLDCEDSRVEEFKNDFVDGVGIGTMWGVGVAGARSEVIAAMNGGNPEEIDRVFEGSTGGVMKGIGWVVKENLVTDQYLVRRLNVIKMAGASQIAIDKAFTEISAKYTEGQVGNQRETEMILTYLGEILEEEGPQQGQAQGRSGGQDQWRSMQAAGETKDGSRSGMAGLWDALRARELRSMDMAPAMTWGLMISELLALNPTYWAGGWREATSYMEQQMNNFKVGALMTSEGRACFEKSRSMVEAVVTLRTMEAAILACDDTLGKYMEMTPPAENMKSYLWNRELRSVLEADPVVRSAHAWIYADAYGSDKQKQLLLQGLKSFPSIDNYVENLAQMAENDRTVNDDLTVMCKDQAANGEGVVYPSPEGYSLRARIRLALSLFIVDEYPRWAVELNKLAGKVDWFPEKTIQRRISGDSFETVPVKSVSANRFGKYETMVGHPFFALYEPGSLLRFKGQSYGEEVVIPFEESFRSLVTQTDAGSSVFFDQKTGELMRLSQINPKNLSRWATAWISIAGDSAGSGMTEYENLEKAVQQIQGMGVSAQWKYDTCGYIVSKWLISKFRALRSADPRSSLDRIVANIGIISEGRLAEESAMLEKLLGKGSSTTYGVLRDLKAQYGLKFGTDEFYEEFTKFYTGAKNNANAIYKWGRGAEIGAAVLNLIGGAVSGGKTGGKRR